MSVSSCPEEEKGEGKKLYCFSYTGVEVDHWMKSACREEGFRESKKAQSTKKGREKQANKNQQTEQRQRKGC